MSVFSRMMTEAEKQVGLAASREILKSPPTPPSATPFQDQQKVSLDRWDQTVPWWDRLGVCRVVRQRPSRACESGWLVTVQTAAGTRKELDSHWLQPVTTPDPGPGRSSP